MSSKNVKPHAYVVIDSRRVAPGIDIPDGYRPLPGIGEVIVDESGNTESRVKSIVDGPIEDILDLQYVATGWREHDGTVSFAPGAVRLLNLIKIGVNAERIGNENAKRVFDACMSLAENTTDEYDVQPGLVIQPILLSRMQALKKQVTR